MATEPEKQQQWTGSVLFLCALLQLLLVYLAYRVDRNKRAPLISTATWAIFFGIMLGFVLSYWSPDRASREGLDPQLLFFGLLPPIVLEAGFNTQRKGFFFNFGAICLLAVLGTLVATVTTGGLVFGFGQLAGSHMTSLSLTEAMLYGALISATDPVATLVVLKKSHAPPLLFNLLFGESVLNDAIVIVIFGIVQKAVLEASNEWLTARGVLIVFLQLFGISIGSVMLAAIICYGSAFCLRHADDALKQHATYEIATLLLSAYASFVVCQSLQLSGLLAVFFSGVLIRHYHLYSVSHAGAAAFSHMLTTVAFLAENLIYLYLGVSLVAYSAQFQWDWPFIGVSLGATLIARACSTFPLCVLANLWRTERIPWRYMMVLWFAGLRGSIAFALALNVRTRDHNANDNAAVIRASTLVTVILTTTVFGAATGPLLVALGLSRRPLPTLEPSCDVTTPLLATTTLTEVDTVLDTVQSPENHHEEHAMSRWNVRRLWVHVDERHLKPIFGGNPRIVPSS